MICKVEAFLKRILRANDGWDGMERANMMSGI